MSCRAAAATAALVGALVAAGCGGDPGVGRRGGASGTTAAPDAAPPTRTVTVEKITSVGSDGGAGGGSAVFDARRVFRRDGPGVVTIISIFSGGPGGPGKSGAPGGGGGGEAGLGSGFVLDGAGDIATNAHVVTNGEGKAIRRAREVYVRFADDNQVAARVVGFDPNADVALLRLQTTEGLTLRPVRLGSSAGVRVGEPVAAIGSPFGEEQSLSVGVVSATGRAIKALTGFDTLGAVQTDAAINQGNSGGPLLDARGRVIGINAQIRTNSGGGEGVGYAIPVDQVRRSVAQIRRGGQVRYAFLGVSTVGVYPQLAGRFGLGTRTGAWIQQVVKGGPGAAGQLRAGTGRQRFQARDYAAGGDVIVAVDGAPVRTPDDLGLTLTRFRPGDVVTLSVFRGGQRLDLRVRLGDRPAQAQSQP